RLVIEMTIYESLVASFANLVVIFASGEWRNLRQEMNDFGLGKKSYVMNLMAPVFSVFFLHEKMSGVKVISMFLAMWGFLSYMYQHYLDDLENKAEKSLVREVS
ncbi:hypothetical protein EJD97_018574, partial [Solanum chilense]